MNFMISNGSAMLLHETSIFPFVSSKLTLHTLLLWLGCPYTHLGFICFSMQHFPEFGSTSMGNVFLVKEN